MNGESGEADHPCVAVVVDGLEALPGLAVTIEQLRERGVPGYEVEVIGTHAGVDLRLPAVAEVTPPQLPDARLGVAGLFAVTAALRKRPYDLVHVCGPGPCGAAASLIARAAGVPVTASVHTALPPVELLGAFHRACRRILSPSRFVDGMLGALGVPGERIVRWGLAVDLERFSPACYSPDAMPAGGAGGTARINLVYAGSLRGSGVGLLAEAFMLARTRDPRLHLVVAGSGPEEPALRRRLGSAATFLGHLERERLARVLASGDLLVCPSAQETFGLTVLEAQASGLPVLAVDGGGAAELIESGRSGCLVPAGEVALAEAIRWLARRATLRQRLTTGGLLAVRAHTWERSLAQLAAGWSEALAAGHAGRDREIARVA